MARHLTPLALALLASVTIPACSLLQLDSFTPPECRFHEDCEILNEIRGIGAGACARFQCTAEPAGRSPQGGLVGGGRCRLSLVDLDNDGHIRADYQTRCRAHPLAVGAIFDDCNDEDRTVRGAGGTEMCDGVDNDCDFVVDEAQTNPDGTTSVSIVPVPSGTAVPVNRARSVSLRAGALDEMISAWSSFSNEANVSVVPAASSTTTSAQMSYASHARQDSLLDTMLVDGCPRIAGDGSIVVGGACNFAEVVVDSSSEHLFALSVNRLGCTRGEPLIGFARRDASPLRSVLRGPARRSASFLGLDRDRTRACPSPDSVGARAPDELRGAARPALDVIDTATVRDQALAVWINDAFTRSECGGPEANVEAVVAFLEEGLRVEPFEWVTASNEGTPETLGRTIGGGAPAVRAWSERGYFVAHGDENGDIAIHFVPRQLEPPPRPAPPDVQYYNGFEGMPNDRTGRVTDPLAGVLHFAPMPVEGNADHLAIEVGRILEGDNVELLLAWRQDCREMPTDTGEFDRLASSIDASSMGTSLGPTLGMPMMPRDDCSEVRMGETTPFREGVAFCNELGHIVSCDTGNWYEVTCPSGTMCSSTGDVVGCDLTPQAVWTRRIVVSPATGTITSMEDAIQLAAPARATTDRALMVGRPSLTTVSGGFLSATLWTADPARGIGRCEDDPDRRGVTRPGSADVACIDARTDGGWWVSWPEAERRGTMLSYHVNARRFSEYDGLAVSPGEVIDFAASLLADLPTAGLYTVDAVTARYAYAGNVGGSTSLREGRLSCEPPACSPAEPEGACRMPNEVCHMGTCRVVCNPNADMPDDACPSGTRCARADRVCI